VRLLKIKNFFLKKEEQLLLLVINYPLHPQSDHFISRPIFLRRLWL